MDEYTFGMEEIAPAFIDITKVEISIDGRTTWTTIPKNGTIHIKEGKTPQYRVTATNTGGVKAELTYIGLYDYDVGGTGTPILEAYNPKSMNVGTAPGATRQIDLDFGMCSPQPTFCPVERNHVYKILTCHETGTEDDTFSFTIAEPAYLDISIVGISPPPPIQQGYPVGILVKVTNTGDRPRTGLLTMRRQDYGGEWSGWITINAFDLTGGGDIVTPTDFNMPNKWIKFEFKTSDDPAIGEIVPITIYEALEGAFKDASLKICGAIKCEENIKRGATVSFQPSDKTPTVTVRNTGGVAQKLTIKTYDITDGGEVLLSTVETVDPVSPDAEVTVELPAFSYPGDTKHYKLTVEP